MTRLSLGCASFSIEPTFVLQSAAFTGPAETIAGPGLATTRSGPSVRASFVLTTSDVAVDVATLAQYVGNQLLELKHLESFRHIAMQTTALTDGSPAILEEHEFVDGGLTIRQIQLYTVLPHERALIATGTHAAGPSFEAWAPALRRMLLSIRVVE